MRWNHDHALKLLLLELLGLLLLLGLGKDWRRYVWSTSTRGIRLYDVALAIKKDVNRGCDTV